MAFTKKESNASTSAYIATKASATPSAAEVDREAAGTQSFKNGANKFEWRGVSYEVGGRKILHNVSGSVASGEMIAIMGSSGAGKTTLLNGTLNGQILLDGQKRNPRLWRRQAAFVEQDDVLYTDLTVRETIEYSARLRLPTSENSPTEIRARTAAVMKSLRLSASADTRIGTTLQRGILSEERKRTAIAQEFVTMPPILFLDEPTSSALAHFEELGFKPRPKQNPADFFMDLLTIDTAKDEAGIAADRQRVHSLEQAFSTAQTGSDTPTPPESETTALIPTTSHRWPNAWTHEASTLTERAFRQLLRDRATIIASLVRTIVLVVLIGFSYFRLARDQRGINNRAGILFFWPINVVLMNMLPIVNFFPTERAILRRERFAGAYRTSAFFASRVAAEVANSTVWTLLSSAPLYFMLGLRSDGDVGPFFVWLLVQWAIAMAALGYGIVIAVLVPSLQVSQVIAPLIALIFMIFGGGVVSTSDTKYPFKIIQWISPINCGH
ncbi:ABC-2 type transporter-domain-containing protein [Zopfochytrium polystomum]|nr:ABC-2 type transporter-domain-containing protein [Zopfochytrium polystomum]